MLSDMDKWILDQMEEALIRLQSVRSLDSLRAYYAALQGTRFCRPAAAEKTNVAAETLHGRMLALSTVVDNWGMIA